EIDPGRFGATYEAFLNAIHPDDRDAVNAAYSRSLQTREPYSITHRLLMPDGRIKHVHEQCVTEFDPDGKPLRSFGTVQDISDQVASQEALHRSMAETERLLAESDRMRRNALSMLEDQQRAEQEIRRLLDEATEREFFLRESQQVGQLGGWRADPVNNKMTWTQGVYELVEMPLDYKPDLEAALDAYLPDSRVQVVENLKRTLETGVPFSIQVQVRGAQSGIAKWTELRGHPHRDTQGRIDYLIGTIQDITSRKRAEEEKEKLQSQLSQAQKMESVGRLAGGVAHDFNNMLGVILGHAEMALGRVDPGQPLFADLLEVRKAAERSADLTSKLLAFARKQTVAPKVLDLNETVEGMLTLLRRLIGEDIDLAWQPGENLAPVRVDPSQLDQILANLCVNARDAIADVGTITIETGAATFDEAYCAEHAGFVPGEYVLLAVSDNGCGMDAETVGHLFEPFFTTKALGKGTGLGLASVYGAVKQNHGFINVYSEPGHGTTFTIYLPRHAARTVQPAENGSEAPVTRGHETILLVEDEPAILRMTAKMLAREGYTVIAAGTPGEAIRLAREHTGPIHLLMTDVVMPEMNGRDLARNLLSIHPGIKRIFMSGYTANVIAHHGVLDEGVHFIQKPISMKGLAAHVREALHRA
ncbi:MAG: response regulator, partial [Gammaproteobacteria bacterium]|nr:response regulator [Gammaproteobacteria bacterium]